MQNIVAGEKKKCSWSAEVY